MSGDSNCWMCPDVALALEEFETFFDRAIEALPPVRRHVYLMAREDDQATRAVASALRIWATAVCQHLANAQRHLRIAFAKFRDEQVVRPLSSTSERAAPSPDRSAPEGEVFPRSNSSAA